MELIKRKIESQWVHGLSNLVFWDKDDVNSIQGTEKRNADQK